MLNIAAFTVVAFVHLLSYSFAFVIYGLQNAGPLTDFYVTCL